MNYKFSNKKTSFRYIILLFAVTSILFGKVILNPSYILWSPISEIITDTAYWDNFRYESMNKYGQLPLWNPYTFSGFPFIGVHWSTLAYPINLVYLFFKSINLYGFVFLLHFFLGGVFVYLFLRKLGIDDFSSFISSVVYVLGLRFVYYVYAGFVEREVTVFLLPLLFYLVESYFQSRKKFYLVLVSIAFTFQFFGDHNQIFLYTWFIVFLYFIFKAFITEKGTLRVSNAAKYLIKYLIIYFLMSALVILLSAVQLFPLMEFISRTSRASGLDYDASSGVSMPPSYLIMLLLPEFFGSYSDGSYWGIFGFWKIATYIGILPIIFVLINFYNRNRYVKFFIFLAIFSLLFAMGRYTPFYYILYKFVPLFQLFRTPSRMLFFFNFSLIVLVGFGLNFLLYKFNSKSLSRLFKTIAIVVVFCLVWLLLLHLFKERILIIGDNILKNKLESSNVAVNSYNFYREKLPIIYNYIFFDILLLNIFLIASLVIFKLKIMKFKFKLIRALIFLVIFVDLGLHSIPLIEVKNPSEVFVSNKLVGFMEGDKEFFRFIDLDMEILRQDKLVGHSLFKIEGFDGLIYEDYHKYASVMGNFTLVPSSIISLKKVAYPKVLDLLNGKYVVADKSLYYPNYELEYSTTSNIYLSNALFKLSDVEINHPAYEFVRKQNFYVYLNKNYLPRAFYVPKAAVLEREIILEKLKEEGFNPRETVLIEKQIDRSLSNKGTFKEAKIEFYSPNMISVSIDIDSPGFLVLSEIWYPGWKAFDNGKETEIYRADYILRSIYLEAGRHKIEFKYEPLSFKLGLWTTLITSFFVIIYFMHALKKK